MGISERYTTEKNEKAPKKRRGPFIVTEVHQEGRFYRLSTGPERTLSHTTYRQKTGVYLQTWKRGDYLMMDPAWEVNEKGTRENNNGNEVVEEETSPSLVE